MSHSGPARRPFVCGNWKMNGTLDIAARLAADVRRLVGSVRQVEVAVAPTFTALHAVAARLEGSDVGLAAQCLHPAESGAHTGEISASMVADVGCRYVLVGHSERRQFNGIDDEAVTDRVAAALAHGLRPIICVGEQLAERDDGATLTVVARQLNAALDAVSREQVQSIVVAYEPVWAIGTGRTATPAQAQEVHAHIRALLRDRFGAEEAASLRVLYGGSVKPTNVDALMAEADVDGALVGGASLDAESFARIVRFKSLGTQPG